MGITNILLQKVYRKMR